MIYVDAVNDDKALLQDFDFSAINAEIVKLTTKSKFTFIRSPIMKMNKMHCWKQNSKPSQS
jgi:7-cyano-7-deazaguanine synthase in queuosine biosynthesis